MKMKHRIKKYEDILVLLFIIIAVMAFALTTPISTNDELWNFSNIYKMNNGEMIYRDCNVIITPLFFYIGLVLFKIFGANYLTFRIYNIVLFTTYYYLIYKLLKTLKINKIRTYIYLFFIYAITYRHITLGANYNILVMNLCLLGIISLIKGKKEWIQGILIFLIFMAKQNIGIFYTIGYIIYCIFKEKSILKAIKRVFIPGIICIGLLGIDAIYLLLQGNLYNYINYAFLGVGEFGLNNLRLSEGIILLWIFMLTIDFVMLWVIKSKKINIQEDVRINTTTLISFALPMTLIAYPIFNGYHVMMSTIFSIITLGYILEKNLLEEVLNDKINKVIKYINYIIIIAILILSIYNNLDIIDKINSNKYPMYFGVEVLEETDKNIENVVKYIKDENQKGKEVKIISYTSDLYMNILNRNNKNMDLPFYGNLGKEGEDGLIKEIEELKNTNVLISKEEDKIYQESKKVRKFIMENYQKIGEVEDFYIYKVGY